MPPEPITPQERRQVLLKLNQVIEHRLVTSEEGVPLRMRSLKIENGTVTFHVENEFDVTLTLMGEGPAVPWRLLKVALLVEDRDTGEGKALVHSMQVGGWKDSDEMSEIVTDCQDKSSLHRRNLLSF